MKNVYVVGFMGAGKDTVADYLIKKYGLVSARFASHLYSIATNYLGMKSKDRLLLQTIGNDIGREMIDKNIWVNRLCQDIDIAQKTAEKLNLQIPNYINSDTRYLNEHMTLKNAGWIGIYVDSDIEIRKKRLINRDGYAQEEYFNHPSEISINEFNKDLYTVSNNGTLEDLYKEVDIFIKKYLTG